MGALRRMQREPYRLVPWAAGLALAAVTEAIWHWFPGWVPVMRIVWDTAGGIIVVVWAAPRIWKHLSRCRTRRNDR